MDGIENPALLRIFRNLNQLSEQLRNCRDPQKRLEVLKEMRLLIGDADKIIDSEMGDL